MRARPVAALGLLSLLAACTNFPVIEANECGNAVLEPGEDCDTFVSVKGESCRPKGVEGECHFDCRANGDEARAACPDGMGCSTDGLCRFPTGDFEPKAKFSSDVSAWLSAVDFDGDGHSEVISTEPPDQLQQARFRLHYFDADSKLVETRTFPRFTTRPLAADVTRDGEQDLVFSNHRVGMVPGREDRDWIPATFSSYVVENSRLRVLGMHHDGVSRATPIVAVTTLNDTPGVYVPNFSSGRLELRAELPLGIEALQGDPIVADIVEGHDSPCGELIVAYRGDDELRVFDMCEPGKEALGPDVVWREVPLEQLVSLPPRSRIDAAPIAADVDGDHHLDLVIGLGGHPYVIPGDGRRLGGKVKPLELPVLESSQLFDGRPMPIAAGDFTGDGLADFVLPGGVLSSRRSHDGSDVAYFPSFGNRAQPWTLAQIADLNGNGLLDVVAAAAGTPGLTFLNGTGGQYQIGARLATSGPVRLLKTGDYDGDLIDDVAFIQSGAPPATKDSLAIAFGTRDGLPLPATRVAEIEGVEQLGDSSEGGMQTIFVATKHSTEGALSSTLTLFDGSPDRLPFATYTLVTFSFDGRLFDSGADALVLGAFSAPDATDVMAIGTSLPDTNSWSLWLLPDIGGPGSPPRLIQSQAPEGIVPRTEQVAGLVSVAGVAADLDGDRVDEALWLMPEGDEACALLGYDFDAASSSAVERLRLHFDQPCALPELEAADLDGDGALDLLALVGDARVEPRQLQVLWNDGSGGLSLSNRTLLADPDGRDIRAFQAYGSGPPKLAFVTDRKLLIASGRDARSLDSIQSLDRFQDARGIVVTDPNGDGFPDIVVADAVGLWLLKAQLK